MFTRRTYGGIRLFALQDDMLKKLLLTALAMLVSSFSMIAAAAAFPASDPSALVAPHDDPATPKTIEVVKGADPFTGDILTANFSGFVANPNGGRYWAMLCNPKIESGSFNSVLDCVQLTAGVQISATGSGSIENIVIGDGGNGLRLTGDLAWECDASGSSTGVTDTSDHGAGPTLIYRDCFVVVREGSVLEASATKNELFPVRFVDPNAPAGAAAVSDKGIVVKSSSRPSWPVFAGGAVVLLVAALGFSRLRRRTAATRLAR